MAVVVSKKTAKSAVVRNQIRRRLYEAVRKTALLENQPIDAVFVVNDESVARAPSADIMDQVSKVCLLMTKAK